MITVKLQFKDGEEISVTIPHHVYELWLGEMKGSLAKYAKIINQD